MAAGARSSPASSSCKRRAAPSDRRAAVRPALPGDANRLQPLVEQGLAESRRRGRAEQRTHLFAGSADEVVGRLLSSDGPLALVAEADDALVGFAVLDALSGALLAVYVLPACRRRGIATALVAAAAAHLEAEGRTITALVSAGDRAEKSLFEQLGFRAELLLMAPRTKE